MKLKLFTLCVLAAASISSNAALIYTGGSGTIPDGLITGWSDSHTFSGELSEITGVTLTLTLQGGFGTDLSGYLRLGDTPTSPFFSLDTALHSQDLTGVDAVTFAVDAGSSFQNLNPNGKWTLFLADTRSGGETAINSWELEIAAVPEPVNVALGIFGGGFVLLQGARFYKRKKCRESAEGA